MFKASAIRSCCSRSCSAAISRRVWTTSGAKCALTCRELIRVRATRGVGPAGTGSEVEAGVGGTSGLEVATKAFKEGLLVMLPFCHLAMSSVCRFAISSVCRFAMLLTTEVADEPSCRVVGFPTTLRCPDRFPARSGARCWRGGRSLVHAATPVLIRASLLQIL